MKNTYAVIAFCSPNGTTKTAAETIAGDLRQQGITCTLVDLGVTGEKNNGLGIITGLMQKSETPLIFCGSPVYGSQAIPPVMDFINGLPHGNGAAAVPFVTWGGVTRGYALYQMSKALQDKGYTVAGGAEVLAVHSLTVKAESPVASGHPDTADLGKLGKLVNAIAEKGKSAAMSAIDISPLREGRKGDPDEVLRIPFSKISSIMPPKKIDEDACTQCRTCVDVCPADAIELTPYPAFNGNCITCFSCSWQCPENAIKVPVEALIGRVKERAEQSTEKRETTVYV